MHFFSRSPQFSLGNACYAGYVFFGHLLFQYHDQVVKIDPRLYSEMPNAKTQYLRATAELVSIFLQFLTSNFLFRGGGSWKQGIEDEKEWGRLKK